MKGSLLSAEFDVSLIDVEDQVKMRTVEGRFMFI